MLSRSQVILCKRAQKQAALADGEYREAIALVSGMDDCRSSRDARLADAHLDHLMSYFEAIYWRKVLAGQLHHVFDPRAVFHHPDYWSSKNQHGNTSRDRYAAPSVQSEILALEDQLAKRGCGLPYFQAIQNQMRSGGRPFSAIKYAAALRRTLAAKRRKETQPF